jgi:DNA-dependent RNA polymerase auxiliary subunit epsilon
MTENISKLFEISIGAFALVLGIALFISLQTSITTTFDQDLVRERLYTEHNDYIEYINELDGAQVSYSIINDNLGYTYIIKDSLDNILITISNCNDTNLLSMLDTHKHYSVNYKIENGTIKTIIYKEG